ncbi:MAG: M24 family metallopeptidase [Candidatus Hodarchaeales archaeon]|jgi:Xaa-Pro aminopeptidase
MNNQKPELTTDEFKIRIDKVQTLLKKFDLDGLIATLEVNFRYLFKSDAHISERLTAVILPKQGKPSLITPLFEKQNMLNSTPLGEDQIYTWEETEDPYVLLASECKRLDLSVAKLSLTPYTPYTVFKQLQSSLPKASFSDSFDIFKEARITKTETELNLLRLAAKYSADAIETSIINHLSSGMTENELSTKVSQELTNLSGEPAHFALVQFGENSAISHSMPTQKKLNNNSVVLIDAGTSVHGYNGDITNTTFFGNPSDEFLEIYGIVEQANEVGVQSAKANTPCEDVDRYTRAVIKEKGYGKFFTHRTGHGIGLEVHEDPYIVEGNKKPLELNQVHSVEPGIYLPNKFGVRIEDDVIVGSNNGLRAVNPNRRLWES